MAKRRPGTAVFRASVSGAAQAGRKLTRAQSELQRAMVADFRVELAQDLREVYSDHAPYSLGRPDNVHLANELEVPVSVRHGRISASVRSPVRSPDSGYAYTPVTRFGHRQAILRPRRGRFLRWENYGRIYYRRSVRGYHPRTDWVDDTRPEAEKAVDRAEKRLGRVIRTVVLR